MEGFDDSTGPNRFTYDSFLSQPRNTVMIQAGASKHETFILRANGEIPTISGSPSAFFGYTVTDGRSETTDGIWAKWEWENDSFELRNDRFGFYPLYYYEKGREFGVSDSIIELIKHGAPLSLDDAAISVFLRLGFYIRNDTPFKAIRALPPAARLRWSAKEGLRIDTAEREPCESGSTPVTRAAAVRRFGELFQSVMERLIPSTNARIALPLSGGRDSRHILFALLRSNRAPDCCITAKHIPPRADEDARVASEMAQFLDIPHKILPQTGRLLDNELLKNRLTNFCADEHAWLLPLRKFLRDGDFTIAYDGIGGDVLTACMFQNDNRLELYGKGKLDELAEDMMEPEGHLPRMLKQSFYQRWNRTLAANHLKQELRKYGVYPNPVSQFIFWNRTRREIALSPWSILNVSCPMVAPYLSGEIYDFLAALPASYLRDKKFHTDAIAVYYPEYAHLPFEAGIPWTARSSLQTIAAFASDTARYFLAGASADNYVNRASFLLPLLLKGVFNADIGTQLPRICNKAIYLRQLALLMLTSART